ncbi:alkene reductase [Plesiomonas shigelloides]|uniref:alkene reductase n=1 Tax=Plesiomonas shigelloides TaxID=703 RepID=UPI00224540A8|nr:alkene reductase [Plesiomonas shigelloides]MCX2496633.1 alkene reductase [Plesiomonas shigelloides]
MSTLFQPYRLNDTLTLANRFIMAPLTRCMAGPGLVPTEQMAAYYGRRADIGLIVSEAVIIRPDAQGYPNTPGLFTQAQIEGWKKVTNAVHANGGKIFAQLWHVGRLSHPFFHQAEVLAPSAVAHEGTVPRMRELTYQVPRALTETEIAQLIQDYAQAAANAIEAGFDGIEIHGANGYLIDQFLHHSTNLRTDKYGGNPENMSRFALEVVDATSTRIGGDRVGIRLSPGAYVHLTGCAEDRAVFDYLLSKLNDRPLAYIHLGIFDDNLTFDYLGGRASDYLRANYKGNLVGVGNYDAERAAAAIETNRFDLVAIGRPLIANPDYLTKVKNGEALVPYSDTMLAELI